MEEKQQYDFSNIVKMTLLEAIRKRPGMYLGQTEFIGVLNMIKEIIFDLIQENVWNKMSFEFVGENTFKLNINQQLIFSKQNGEYLYLNPKNKYCYGINAIFALSSEVQMLSGNQSLHYENGKLIAQKVNLPVHDFQITFTPDEKIFKNQLIQVISISTFLDRLTLLSLKDLNIELITKNSRQTFKKRNGLMNLFQRLNILAEPVSQPMTLHLVDKKIGLTAKIIFSFQTKRVNNILTFVYSKEVPLGGTHIEGFEKGLNDILHQLTNKKDYFQSAVGILAMISLNHPAIVYKGCTKEKIGNEEFKDIFRQLTHQAIMEQKDTFLNMIGNPKS